MCLPPPAPDSIALVTGASSGIGEQYARQLSKRGYRVAIVARREDRLANLAEQLSGPERAGAIAADLTVAADRDRLSARIDELGARVEVLVNNAGYGIYAVRGVRARPRARAGAPARRGLGRSDRSLSAGDRRAPPRRGHQHVLVRASIPSPTTPPTPRPGDTCCCSPKPSTPRSRSTA
jgi:NAD(P)-dependent dehydrogenase (short-subunit alcohol dehydrogenase family)